MRDFEEYRDIISNYYESKHFYNYVDEDMLKNPIVMNKLDISKETKLFLEFLTSDERIMYFEFLSDIIEYRNKKAKEKEDGKFEKENRKLKTQSTKRTNKLEDHLQQAIERLSGELESGQLSSSDLEIITPTQSPDFDEQTWRQQTTQSIVAGIEQTLPTISEEMAEKNLRSSRLSRVQMQKSPSTPRSSGLSHVQMQESFSAPKQSEIVQEPQTTSTPLHSHEQQQLQSIEDIEETQISLPKANTSDPIVDEFRNMFASYKEKSHENFIPSNRSVTKKKKNLKQILFHKATEFKLEEVQDRLKYGNYRRCDPVEKPIDFIVKHIGTEIARSRAEERSYSQPIQGTPKSISSDEGHQRNPPDFDPQQQQFQQQESLIEKPKTPELDIYMSKLTIGTDSESRNLSQQQQSQQELRQQANTVEEIPEIITYDRHSKSLTDGQIEEILTQENEENMQQQQQQQQTSSLHLQQTPNIISEIDNLNTRNDLTDTTDEQQQQEILRHNFETERNWREILRSHLPFIYENGDGRDRHTRKRKRRKRRLFTEDDNEEEVIPPRRKRQFPEHGEISQQQQVSLVPEQQELVVPEHQSLALEQQEISKGLTPLSTGRSIQNIQAFDTDDNFFLNQTAFQIEYNRWKKSTFEDLSIDNIKRCLYSMKFDMKLLNMSLNRELFELIKLLSEKKFLKIDEILPPNLNKRCALRRFNIILEMDTQKVITVNKTENGNIIDIRLNVENNDDVAAD